MLLIKFAFMAIRTANNVNMFFTKRFVKKPCSKGLVWGQGVVADWALAADSGLTGGVAVRAAGNCHYLVGNVHGAVNFGDELFAYEKFALADGATDGLHVFLSFGF